MRVTEINWSFKLDDGTEMAGTLPVQSGDLRIIKKSLQVVQKHLELAADKIKVEQEESNTL